MATRFDPRVTPWEIEESEFHGLRSAAARVKFLLRYAVLAPSSHNTQPWRFEVNDRGVLVFADYRRRLVQADPDNRELLMSIGTALFNLRVAAAHFGYHCAVLYTPRAITPELVATVDLWPSVEGERIDEELKPLFPSIRLRHTNRGTFEPRAVSASELDMLSQIRGGLRASIRFLTSPRLRGMVAQLVGVGDRIQMGSVAFRQEIAGWIRPSFTTEKDGLTADAVGIPPLFGPTSPWFIRHFDFGFAVSDRSYRLSASAPALAVIEAADDPASLVEAGELLERLLLTLTSLDLQYSLLNQPIQVPGLRLHLRRLLRSRLEPQILLRIGYGEPVRRAAPRRAIDDVVDRVSA